MSEKKKPTLDELLGMYEEGQRLGYEFDTIFIAPWWKKLYWYFRYHRIWGY